MQGKLPITYDYGDLLETGRVTFNNLNAEDTWGEESKLKKNEKEPAQETRFLALMTKLTDALGSSATGKEDSSKSTNGKRRSFQPWRFKNPNNEKTKVVRGTTMRWCKNDCHEKPMWCGRKTCLNHADFAKKMQDKRNSSNDDSGRSTGSTGSDGSSGVKVNDDFKIALQAMTSSDDFKMLEQQFFSGN